MNIVRNVLGEFTPRNQEGPPGPFFFWGLLMPVSIQEACSQFCRRYLCPILVWIVAAGCSVAAYALMQGVEIDRMARETSLRQQSTAGSLDAHLAEERAQNEKVMDALGAIQSDIAVMKYRMDQD